jgi:capsular exopolysaccharide synthesis family protein
MASLVESEALPLGRPEPGGAVVPGAPYPPAGAYVDSSASEPQGTNPLELAWRARWMILLGGLIGALASWVQLQRVTPRYTSLSRIYVERSLPRLLEEQVALGGNSSTYLGTQVELIRSTPVLAAALEMPENKGLAALRGVSNPIGLLRDKLAVTLGQNNDLISIALETSNPEDSARLVNSVVESYIGKYAENRKTDTVEILRILRGEKERRDQEVAEARQALENFRRTHPELAVQVRNENIVSSRFSTLSEELDGTMLQLLDAQALFRSVSRMYENPELHPFLYEMARGDKQLAPANVGEQTLQSLQRQHEELELDLLNELAQWGEGHRKVKVLREALAAVQQRLVTKEQELEANQKAQQDAVVSAYLQSLQQNQELLQQKHDQLKANYEAQFAEAKKVSSLAQELASLQETLAAAERTNAVIDERIKEVNLTEDVGAMNVSIMEPASPSFEPSYPVPSKFMFLGITLGAMAGLGLIWVRDLLDQRLRSIDEVVQVLQVPVVGSVQEQPKVRGDKTVAGRVVLERSRSVAAEEFRTLRTAVHFGLAGDECKTLCITSPHPGDGKSTVTSNLAIANAQAGRKVLLIDADMRKPTQHKVFQIENVERGLSNVLLEGLPVEEAVVATQAPGLDLLPCGPLPANPVELLTNGAFSALLAEVRDQYDKIIVDCPPVLPVADARILGALTEATLLVLRAERTTRRMATAARNELLKVRIPRLGVVVNGVPLRKHAAYSGYTGYGYRRYGGGGYGGYGGYGEYGGYGAYGYYGEQRQLEQK